MASASGIGTWGKWLFEREQGKKSYMGYNDQMKTKLYNQLYPYDTWDPLTDRNISYGGIFNLEFTPDGSLLVGTAENRSLLLFDPLNYKLINSVSKAHEDCVNYARFLDSRLLATCSDDTTVALWDVRYLRNKVRTLVGHSNWVKNIEYSRSAGLLVTSGFDGSIYTWDINKYTESELQYQQVFHTKGLMRMRLTTDSSKMIICTSGGYMMVIHDLDFHHLKSDLHGFKPNIYRLMQKGTPFARGYNYNHLFTADRNRVELISDFPHGNDAEVISSLQVHPEGWCVLSRNTSSDEQTEWTCVHDIQDFEGDESPYEEQDLTDLPPRLAPSSPFNSIRQSIQEFEPRETFDLSPDRFRMGSSSIYIRYNYGAPGAVAATASSSSSSSSSSDQSLAESIRIGNLELRMARERGSGPVDLEIGARARFASFIQSTISHVRSQAPTQPNYLIISGMETLNSNDLDFSNEFAFGGSGNDSEPETPPSQPPFIPFTNQKYHTNSNRLMYFIEEPNVGRGYIKELCFSSDGRLVCSPFGHGVRLMSFNENCSELSKALPTKPQVLHKISFNVTHSNFVVSTKFSPTHCLLVSGCLSGKICFHQPMI